MNKSFLLAAAALLLPASAQAHRMWMMPSASVVSGDDTWVTVDAAVSNDLFYFEHQPLRIQPTVTEPDGAEGKAENLSTGRYRTTFDVHIVKKGTYRIAAVSDGVMGSYMLAGVETRLPRGTTSANLAAAIPAGATGVKTSRNANRNEIYVTSGAPTTAIFKPTGKGIELAPVTHPNDLVAGEKATFKFLLDGKPAAGLPVTIIPGGIRYRDKLNQIDAKTAADGSVSVTWPAPGMYWLNVTSGATGEGPGGGMGGPGRGWSRSSRRSGRPRRTGWTAASPDGRPGQLRDGPRSSRPLTLRIAIPQAASLAALTPPPAGPVVTVGGETMGTSWSARLAGGAPDAARAIVQPVLDRIVREMSQWEDDSSLSRFNRAPAGHAQSLEPDFATVIATALEVAAASNGAFDPAIGALTELWGFGAAGRRSLPPSDDEIATALAASGYGALRWEAGVRRLGKTRAVALDLAGIAKGHAADAVADALTAAGWPRDADRDRRRVRGSRREAGWPAVVGRRRSRAGNDSRAPAHRSLRRRGRDLGRLPAAGGTPSIHVPASRSRTARARSPSSPTAAPPPTPGRPRSPSCRPTRRSCWPTRGVWRRGS